MVDFYEIRIAKRRNPDDRFGIFWGKVELPDYDEEKAKEKFDMMRLLFGGTFIMTMTGMRRQEDGQGRVELIP